MAQDGGAQLRLNGGFRRLTRDYARLPGTLAGLHLLAFALLMGKRVVAFMVERA